MSDQRAAALSTCQAVGPECALALQTKEGREGRRENNTVGVSEIPTVVPKDDGSVNSGRIDSTTEGLAGEGGYSQQPVRYADNLPLLPVWQR